MSRKLELKQEFCDQLEESDFSLPPVRQILDSKQQLVARINQLSGSILRMSSRFCQIDVFDTLERDKRRAIRKADEGLQVASRSQSGIGGHDDVDKADNVEESYESKQRLLRWSSLWPKLIALMTAYCTIKFVVNICFQYSYDRNLLRLKWALKHPDWMGDIGTLEQLRTAVSESRRRLKAWGAPHANGTIVIETAYLSFLGLCLVGYVLGQIYFRYSAKYDFYLIRAILDRRREQLNCNKLILAEANKFIESRRVYTNLCLEQCKLRDSDHSDSKLAQQQQQQQHPDSLAKIGKIVHKLVLDHRLMIRQFKLMAESGALVPLNRTDDWIDLMSVLYCNFNCSCYAWSVVFDVAFAQLIPKLGGFTIESEPLDILFDLDLVLMCFPCVIPLIFYMSTCIISCLDQARLISKVHELILDCIRNNTRLYYSQGMDRPAGVPDDDFRFVTLNELPGTRAVSPTPSSAPSSSLHSSSSANDLEHPHRDRSTIWVRPVGQVAQDVVHQYRADIEQHHKFAQLNANLLHTLMHYKIFVVQLQPILKPVGFVTFVSISMMILHPVMVRLHTPYVDNVELKSKYYIISLITAWFVNMNIVPVCYINSRCNNLYNALFSLLAHTIELTLAQGQDLLNLPLLASSEPADETFEQQQQPFKRSSPTHLETHLVEVYDSHTIWSLRRELKSSERFVKQFETKAFGMTFNYQNLMRIYFWLGAISMSILLEPNDHSDADPDSLQKSTYNRFLRDPFGFYSAD